MTSKDRKEVHRYYIELASLSSVVLGAFLIIEHIARFGGIDPTIGHEWYGFIFICVGMILGLFSRKKKK